MFVVGMVGPFGSGCTHIANEFFKAQRGYAYISLSELLREEYIKRHPDTDEQNIPREILQDFGNELRLQDIGFLAKMAVEKAKQFENANYLVIDSIRNPGEVNVFKKTYVDFFVLGVFANSQIRWNRVADKYHGNQGKFLEDEKRDKGEKIAHGQRVTDTFLTADAIILNEEKIIGENDVYKALDAKIKRYISLFDNTAANIMPSEIESIMTMAYGNSLRSSCLKRKVGAAIVDKNGNIFSSGYNEVPSLEKPCKSEFGDCYRFYAKKQIEDIFPPGEQTKDKVMEKVKLLEKCRALHAEENAILNVARFGSAHALSNATLYTTTYPCNLCANKIAQIGIKKVVYFEPYPVPEAKETLSKAGITQEMFEGITFNAYFKVFNEIIL